MFRANERVTVVRNFFAGEVYRVTPIQDQGGYEVWVTRAGNVHFQKLVAYVWSETLMQEAMRFAIQGIKENGDAVERMQ